MTGFETNGVRCGKCSRIKKVGEESGDGSTWRKLPLKSAWGNSCPSVAALTSTKRENLCRKKGSHREDKVQKGD